MIDIFGLIRQMCSDGVVMQRLDDVCDIRGRIGFRGYTRNDMVDNDNGAISLSPGNIENQHIIYGDDTRISWDKYNESPEIMVFNGDIILCKTASIGKVALVENLLGKATINPQLVVLKDIKCNNRFLWYVLSAVTFQRELEKKKGDGTVPNISQDTLKGIKIPFPPLQIQREIVAILDKFDVYCNDMTAGLAGELEMRRKQYRYWANALIMDGNVQMVKLGSICKICKGQQLNKDAYSDGAYPVWNMGAEPSGTHDTYNRDVPTIVIAGHGNSVGTVNWVDEPFWAGGGCYYLDGFSEDVNDRYLFHALSVRERFLMGLASDGPIRNLYPRTIARAQVPVPVSASGTGAWDAARQQFICDILDNLCELERELERELEMRRKQYGYYRDMLLAFPEKKGA